MNKLTKVGLSALCSSLAAVSSVNAGEMTVTGGVDMSWISLDGGDGNTGNPIGMGSNLTFKGSGELDNGWTFDVTVAMLNQDAYSNTVVNVDMGSLGKLNFNQGDSGNGVDAMDDKMPTAWEEPWGMGLGTGVQLVSGVGTQSNVQYTSPTIGGITLVAAVAPDVGAGNTNDKGNAVGGGNTGAGYDATVNVNPSFGTEILSGLDLFIGAHMTEHHNNTAQLNNRYEVVGGITFDIGPLSLGYATSGISTGSQVGTDVDYYKNHMYGVAFNINDDLSISYGNHQSRRGLVSGDLPSEGAIDMDMVSYQVAYTMGGASIRYAKTEVTNGSYQDAAAFDKEARVISVSLAF